MISEGSCDTEDWSNGQTCETDPEKLLQFLSPVHLKNLL